MYAVLGNQPKMCEVCGLTLTSQNTPSTQHAGKCSSLWIVSMFLQVLLQLGANVNTTDAAGLTPLLWAAYRARAQAMKVLLRCV